jgi:8-oxo-dGTP diphosphatase
MADKRQETARIVPRPGVSAVVFRDGKVLLGQRGKVPLRGVWSLPGGRVEPGETVLQAACRELAEETGIEADLRGILDVADVILRNEDGTLRAQYVLTVFYGTWRRGKAVPGGDCAAVQWADPDALEGFPLTKGAAKIIARARDLMRS